MRWAASCASWSGPTTGTLVRSGALSGLLVRPFRLGVQAGRCLGTQVGLHAR